jgi:hypothetical protein
MAKAAPAAWPVALKQSLRDAGIPRGWSITKAGAVVRLRVRQGAGGAQCWSKSLPGMTWEIGCIGPVTAMLTSLHQAVATGKTLDEAWAELQGADDADPLPAAAAPAGVNWPAITNAFYRNRETTGTRIGVRTMAAEKRYVGAALALLTGPDAPTTPYKLIAQTIQRWADNHRARKQCVEAVLRVLTYAVAHEGLSEDWILPAPQKAQLVGIAPKRTEKATLTDTQILELIDACPSAEWQHVLALMATYGLRPEELFHLDVRVNHPTGKRQFWCSYEKASGKHRTKQRWLQALPLRDAEGRPCHAELVAAWDAGLLNLPPMKERGEAVSQYLRRQPLWQQWRKEEQGKGKVLRPYALRDSYSLRAHLAGVPSASVALAMGHSDATHCSHYTWATNDSTTAVFERLLQVS